MMRAGRLMGVWMALSCAAPAAPPVATTPVAAAPQLLAPPCVPPALFCDGFEAHPAGASPRSPWNLRLRDGAVAVDETRAFRGRRSVHIRTLASGDRQRRAMMGIEGAPLFEKSREVLAGRMMVWLERPPSSNAHFSLVEGEGVLPGAGSRAKSRYGGQFKRLMANYDTDRRAGLFTDCAKRAPEVELPVGRWICLEWRFDAPANEMRLWLDGAAIDALTVAGRGDVCLGHALNDEWKLPHYDAIRVGFQHFQSMEPVDLWVDEVALGGERIGCPAP